MKEFVFKVGANWFYAKDLKEIFRYHDVEVQEFDDSIIVQLSDTSTAQAYVIRQGTKYGVYSADKINTFCNPTLEPFPYDEVRICSFYGESGREYGYFAFRIENKWGILQVADSIVINEKGVYDVEYAATKRRIVVPCKYVALEDAELQLGESYDWKDPFEKEEVPQLVVPAKRVVKKGTGRDKIRVTFPDGMIIEDSVVWKTMAETIKRIGVERVEKLKIPGIEKSNIFLVDTHLTADVRYRNSQKEIAPGYYLLPYNNTPTKAKYLQRISDELHLNLKIEVIPYQL